MFCWRRRQVVRFEILRRQNQLDLATNGTQPGLKIRSFHSRLPPQAPELPSVLYPVHAPSSTSTTGPLHQLFPLLSAESAPPPPSNLSFISTSSGKQPLTRTPHQISLSGVLTTPDYSFLALIAVECLHPLWDESGLPLSES